MPHARAGSTRSWLVSLCPAQPGDAEQPGVLARCNADVLSLVRRWVLTPSLFVMGGRRRRYEPAVDVLEFKLGGNEQRWLVHSSLPAPLYTITRAC